MSANTSRLPFDVDMIEFAVATDSITELHVAVSHTPVAGIINRWWWKFVRRNLAVSLPAIMHYPGGSYCERQRGCHGSAGLIMIARSGHAAIRLDNVAACIDVDSGLISRRPLTAQQSASPGAIASQAWQRAVPRQCFWSMVNWCIITASPATQRSSDSCRRGCVATRPDRPRNHAGGHGRRRPTGLNRRPV